MITLRPKEHGMKVKPEHIEKTYKLNNGEALYVTKPVRGFNLLILERDVW